MKIFELIKRLVKGQGSSPSGRRLEDIKLRYREFKYLLRANNELLNIIAEIESQMDSAAATGLDFISSRYISASAKVFKMILHINRISGDRYRGLHHAFDQIRHHIDDALAPASGNRIDALVLPLPEVDRDMGYLAGSKAANLARAGKLALPIPDGFVITTTAFRRFMTANSLDGQLRQDIMLLEDLSYHSLTQMSRRVQDRIMAAGIPADLSQAILKAAQDLYSRSGGPLNLSLRSSAVGEDSELSFAGQYRSVLNVAPNGVLEAYREVLASLYEPQAIVYRRRHDLRDEDAEMAVLVLTMLDPTVSGVMYTRDPRQGSQGPLLINAVYGLGQGLVEGAVTPDVYTVSRQDQLALLSTRVADKATRFSLTDVRAAEEPLPTDLATKPTLTRSQTEELAELGLALEADFGEPQDVEWALLPQGQLYILQSRPLQLLDSRKTRAEEIDSNLTMILEGGEAARPGVGAGPVHLVFKDEDLASFPDGGVLVARKSSPIFACVLDRAAAVVTEVGGVTGHMASLAREFGVPTIVGVKGATTAIAPGQVITVNASARRVYAGKTAHLSATNGDALLSKPKQVRARPPWHKVAQFITPLTLTNPKADIFRPDQCRTFHDIIRFIHEKSFSEMFLLGDALGSAASGEARKLANKLPFAMLLIDLGGGLVDDAGHEVTLEHITSIPGRAFLDGLLDPRIRWDRPRPVSLRGLASVFSRSMFTPQADGQDRDIGETTFAIISGEYINFNSRVGYHFAALDSVCGPVLNDNYISFRFQGGAATEDRRTLRAELIARILQRLGFDIRQKADMVHAFVQKYDLQTSAGLLAELGRLTLYTRQMDMLCHDHGMVEWLAQAFVKGNYNLEVEFETEGGVSKTFTA